MKIIQLCGQLEGFGVTRFIIELNKALKQTGNNVEIYYCPSNNKQYKGELDVIEYDYSPKMLTELNNADVVFVNQLMPAKINKIYREPFFKLITEEITKPKKVFFINCHTPVCHNIYGKELLNNENFLNSFDYIATFNNTTKVYEKIKNTIGKENALNKFLHMHLPYTFDEKYINNWEKPENKYKRISYIGRWASFKHPEQVLKLHKIAKDKFEFEMRGIDRAISTVCIPDLYYELKGDKTLSFKDNIIGPSKYTTPITTKWKQEHNLNKDDLLIDFSHKDNTLYLFGKYKREDGLMAMRKSAFGAEFFRLKGDSYYGDNTEYAQIEIIEQGTIPLFDYHAGKNIKIYENGYPTDNSMLDLNMGIYLKDDNSNIEEVINQMEELYNNPKLYNDIRNNTFEHMKKHTDPISIVNRLLNEIF